MGAFWAETHTHTIGFYDELAHKDGWMDDGPKERIHKNADLNLPFDFSQRLKRTSGRRFE